MVNANLRSELIEGIKTGSIVPYLGPGVLDGVVDKTDNTAIPADSDSLILAMNNGKPMAPKLMYEFPRAAMNLELKKGRKFIERCLTTIYGERQWSDSGFHRWLADLHPRYVIDVNRDTQMQQCYAERAHTLVVGRARLSGTHYRFSLYQYHSRQYRQVAAEEVDASLPILFKPMGTPWPEPHYIASDADYVDYITELMGGFGMPAFLKLYRQKKRYLFMGLRLLRDTERMVLSDIIHGADDSAGWVLIPEPTEKERRFCRTKNLQLIESDWTDLVHTTSTLHLPESAPTVC
jgi:hypothetical protein